MDDLEKPAAELPVEEPVEGADLSAYQVMEDTVRKYMSTASVDAVFSKPVQQGDVLVVTAAEVMCGFGFGVGEGMGQLGEQKSGGTGGGGGGQTFARPVAVVVCTPNGVSIQPVIDRSKLWMVALTALAFMVATTAKMRRPPRR